MFEAPDTIETDSAPPPEADWRWWQVVVSIAAALAIAMLPVGPMVATLLSDWEPSGDYGAAVPQPALLKEFLPIPEYDDGEAQETLDEPVEMPEEEEEPEPEAQAPPPPPLGAPAVIEGAPNEATLDLMLPEATEEQLAAYADGEEEGEGTADAEEYGDGDEGAVRTGRSGDRERRRPSKKSKSTSKTPPKPCTDFHPGISKVDDTHYNVERALVEYYATHIFELQQLGSVWTHKDVTGAPDGFQIGIRRCGILWQTGFRSRDIVHSVNGRTITTIFQALQAYFALRNQEVFVIEVKRKGKPLTMTYTLVDDRTRDEIRAAQKAAKQDRREAKQVEKALEKEGTADAPPDGSGSK